MISITCNAISTISKSETHRSSLLPRWFPTWGSGPPKGSQEKSDDPLYFCYKNCYFSFFLLEFNVVRSSPEKTFKWNKLVREMSSLVKLSQFLDIQKAAWDQRLLCFSRSQAKMSVNPWTTVEFLIKTANKTSTLRQRQKKKITKCVMSESGNDKKNEIHARLFR